MAAWIQCPTCALKHSARDDGLCPKCKTAVVDPLAHAPRFDAGPMAPAYSPAAAAPAVEGDAPWLEAPPDSRFSEVRRPKDQGAGIRSFLFAMGLSSIGAMAWAWVIATTNYEIGYLAVAIGWLAGMGARLGSKPGQDFGEIAALTAISGIMLGKVLVVTVGVGTMASSIADEYTSDERLMINSQIDVWAAQGIVAPWMARRDDGRVAGGPDYDHSAYQAVIWRAKTAVEAMSVQERHFLGKAEAEREIRSASVYERFAALTSFWDLLWMFLAVSTAWKVQHKDEEYEA